MERTNLRINFEAEAEPHAFNIETEVSNEIYQLLLNKQPLQATISLNNEISKIPIPVKTIRQKSGLVKYIKVNEEFRHVDWLGVLQAALRANNLEIDEWDSRKHPLAPWVEKHVYFKDKLTDTIKNFDTNPDFNIAGALRNAKRKLKNQGKSYASHSKILPKPPDTRNDSLQEQDLDAANIVFNDLFEIGESVSETESHPLNSSFELPHDPALDAFAEIIHEIINPNDI